MTESVTDELPSDERLKREMHDREYPVDEDIALQRKIWRFERIGWYGLLAVVVLTLLGLFSHGPLSSTQVSSARHDLEVSYERFHRNGATNTLIIRSHGQPGAVHVLVIAPSLLEGFSVDSLQPQPVHSSGSSTGLRLTVQADAQGESVTYLGLRADGIGLYSSTLRIDGGGEVLLKQFIYP
ncbi:hypothetical protein N5D61_15895 [Pseudomonas sp. GD03842]|uniref:hypothetical protein n=1 Tax=Pseudomonas sp. GD03842 TaxID=2975385 RepID=UPI00244774B7|nr:hypothetical protein [Pseudomonas sp. GD03842]MDH0747819.1 hypothetical protein [Pseudomonas sp. GD03842]